MELCRNVNCGGKSKNQFCRKCWRRLPLALRRSAGRADVLFRRGDRSDAVINALIDAQEYLEAITQPKKKGEKE